MKRMTVLFDDEELYTAVKVEAVRRNQPLRAIVTVALREWLELEEDAVARAEIQEARRESNPSGRIEASELFALLRQEEQQSDVLSHRV